MPEPRDAAARQKAYKARLAAAGLKQISLWIRPEDEAAVRAYDKRDEAKKPSLPPLQCD